MKKLNFNYIFRLIPIIFIINKFTNATNGGIGAMRVSSGLASPFSLTMPKANVGKNGFASVQMNQKFLGKSLKMSRNFQTTMTVRKTISPLINAMTKPNNNDGKNDKNKLGDFAKNMQNNMERFKWNVGNRIFSVVDPFLGNDKIPLEVLMKNARAKIGHQFNWLTLEETLFESLMDMGMMRSGMLKMAKNKDGKVQLSENPWKYRKMEEAINYSKEDIMKLGIVFFDLLFNIKPSIKEMANENDGDSIMDVEYSNGGDAEYDNYKNLKTDFAIWYEARRLLQILDWDVQTSAHEALGENLAIEVENTANRVWPKNVVERAFIALGAHGNAAHQQVGHLIRLIMLTRSLLHGDINGDGLIAYLKRQCKIHFQSANMQEYYVHSLEYLAYKYWYENKNYYYTEEFHKNNEELFGKMKGTDLCTSKFEEENEQRRRSV